MARAAPGCRHANRCLQGCPSGGKWSMEASLVPTALAHGARLRPERRVERIVREGGRAAGVELVRREGTRRSGRRTRARIRARRGVLLAAGAIHSPLLLRRSGLASPHIGRHFQCHVGTAVVAEFPRPASEVCGPSLGYEVFPEPDLKCNSLAPTPPEIALANIPAVGSELVALLRRFERVSVWNNSLRCGREGRVGGWLGLPRIRLTPGPEELARVRSAVAHLSRLLFEAGASAVYPGLHGAPRRLGELREVEAVQRAPLDPRAYTLNVSHLFGTCRMASRPQDGVVRPDFASHELPGLWVIDASVFPSNIGTNPQLAVMTLARHAVRGLLS
jgi:choline dehydrogenase-like flavoprotein